jgi:glycine cleavage system aminomethyltransferase T
VAFDLHTTRPQSDEHVTTRCGRPEHTSRLDESRSWKVTAYIGGVSPVSIAGPTIRALRQGVPGETGLELRGNPRIAAEVHAALPGREFMGREAVPAEKPGPRGADRGEADGRLVGVMMSRKYSYCSRRMPARCPIDVQYDGPGTEVTVGRGNPGGSERRIRVTVAPALCEADRRRLGLRAAV